MAAGTARPSNSNSNSHGSRAGADAARPMLARIAQELYWLGRDLARGEHTARMLDGAFHADVAGADGRNGVLLSWDGVLAIIGAKGSAAAAAEADPPIGTMMTDRRMEVTSLLTLDPNSPASIVSCAARARDRGRALRDVISTEMWQALNAFHLALGGYDLPAALQSGPYSVYQEVKERCALIWGLADRTMLQDEARAFLEAGGRIEEADMVLRMLRVAVPADASADATGGEAEALALLHAVGGVQAYRRAVRSRPTLETVAAFLLYEGTYPASVASSVEALCDALGHADAQPRFSAPVLRLGRLIADLELQRRAPAGGLDQQLSAVADQLQLVEEEIDERYFSIAGRPVLHL